MSSRALRKLQREQEKQSHLTSMQEGDKEEDEVDDTEDDEIQTKPPKPNLFDMLNQTEDNDEEETTLVEDISDAEATISHQIDQRDSDSASDPEPKKLQKKKSKKRKKKKGKEKEKEKEMLTRAITNPAEASGLDEIDAALKELKTKGDCIKEQDKEPKSMAESDYVAAKQLYSLLGTDTKSLNALNEMKRLFGNAVLEEDNEAEGPNPGRRRGRGARALDLGGAFAGQNSPVSRGKGLVGLALRRNIFMLGKEEWPKATSGGLGMEVVEKAYDHTTEYRFVHNATYQDTQKQFESCVESLDPQRLIQHLHFNPYHISTLLQVSEIAKQQGDHSVSGDLLERALFSFGRSIHSSFPNALAQGEARLDFRRPENREFWLAVWRYISNLGQRGTWRTAYEWAKLLLSLDPEGDPYQIRLIIDQLALRGGQFEQFLNLASTKEWYAKLWANFPNIQISKALAEHKLKRSTEARRSLETAIMSYPWVFARMFRELNVDDIPRSVWGKRARNEREEFECEIYVTRAKDIWNTPEATSFLVEVTRGVRQAMGKPPHLEEITLDEARHVLLSGIPPLISLLPRKYTTMRTRASDPLPPLDNLPSYGFAAQLEEAELDNRRSEVVEEVESETSQAFMQMTGLPDFITRILPPWLVRREVQRAADGQPPTENGETPNPPEDSEEPPAGLMNIEELLMGQEHHQLMLDEVESNDDEDYDDNNSMTSSEDFNRDVDEPGFDMFPAADENDDANSMLELESVEPAQPTSHPSTTNPTPSIPNLSVTDNSSFELRPPTPPPYDEDQNKRWLAGRGLIALREFVQQYSSDEASWWKNPEIIIDQDNPPFTYAKNILRLENKATKNFIFNHALPQGTSAETKDLISRFIADLGNPFINTTKFVRETEPLVRWLKSQGLWWLMNWDAESGPKSLQTHQETKTPVMPTRTPAFTYARHLWALKDKAAKKEIFEEVLPARISETTQKLIRWMVEEKGDHLRDNKAIQWSHLDL